MKGNSLPNRRDVGKWVLSIFLVKIIATIFDFKSSRRSEREKILIFNSSPPRVSIGQKTNTS